MKDFHGGKNSGKGGGHWDKHPGKGGHGGKHPGKDDHGGKHPGKDGHCGPKEPGCEDMIHIGKLHDMDPNEKKPGAEYAHKYLGGKGFGDPDNPLYSQLVEVNLNDKNGDGIIKDDGQSGGKHWGKHGKPETITHDATGSSKDYLVDSAFLVKNTSVTFLNEDGTTETVKMSVRVMQDTGGNTFIMPPPVKASVKEIEMMTSRPIVSVEFSKNPKDFDLCYDSIFTDRACFPCFVRGTLIETEFGALPIQDLREGMKVWTRDNGMQPIRWIGSRKLGATILATAPNLAPIRIKAGALGAGKPERDLLVSPQHRVLVRSRIAQKIFGCDEVLIAAKQLLQIEGIDVVSDLPEVEYFHILFDRHEIVLSEGAETESLYTGAEALRSLGHATREEIFTLFPNLRDTDEADAIPGARLLASGRLGRKLAVRHVQNRKALVQ